MLQEYEDKDGIIEVALVGNMGPNEMTKLMSQTLAKAMANADKGIPVNILCDTSRLESMVVPMKSMISQGLKDLEVRRLAFFGAPPKYPQLREEIAELSGLTGNLKHFGSREEAIVWLKSE